MSFILQAVKDNSINTSLSLFLHVVLSLASCERVSTQDKISRTDVSFELALRCKVTWNEGKSNGLVPAWVSKPTHYKVIAFFLSPAPPLLQPSLLTLLPSSLPLCVPHKSPSAVHVFCVTQKLRMRLETLWWGNEEFLLPHIPSSPGSVARLLSSLARTLPELLRGLRHQNTQWGVLAWSHSVACGHTHSHTLEPAVKMQQQESTSSDSLSGKCKN